MDLSKIIQETEKLGLIILFSIPDSYEEKGRLVPIRNRFIIIVNIELDDDEKIQVILHERAHFKSLDTENILSHVPTYQHRIENEAEKDRIRDFMSLIAHDYPIDDDFNYIKFMEKACIPSRYESFVKETAQDFYLGNEENEK
ncbi:ImmA/IrrE family metallo-endopeptidase [Pseudolactococcus insecticola]|uniref:IrrE N-terminal-like domain-containing protein n=1 Tax=Pseudolactococcus insecticola TaxID=2709158 RepID=A0A6A0B7C4_9LACT|nr:ImmA/IrrE family metallo-endopeptidase [Lactococcus insecticola]GFH40846.1 hypothetical protein Hs20B_12440 [Lactococcus insecticola]